MNTDSWNCQGQYYKRGTLNYRRLLNLGYDLNKASDVLVIMMNPGGSKPVNGLYNNLITEAVQDKTQNKIQTIMNHFGWNKATIINISDVVDPKSGSFYAKLKTLPADHSIFHISRRTELETICNQLKPNAKVLVAWGVGKQTAKLREQAYSFLKERVGEPIGFVYGMDAFCFVHPMAFKLKMDGFRNGGFIWENEILRFVE